MKYQIILLCLLSLPVVQSCNDAGEKAENSVYSTMTLDYSDRVLESEYAAVINGRQYVEIRPQVGGVITEICIDEGEPVKKGQKLFVIDQVPYKAALNTAEANVKSAEAFLSTSKLTYESKKALFEQNVVSEYDFRMAENAMNEAEAALSVAVAERIKAENELSYTEVTSPVNGVTGMIPYKVGALVDSNISEPLVCVSDDDEMYVYFSIAESRMLDMVYEYGSLSEAMDSMPEVSLRLSNGKIYGKKGRIDAISGTIEKTTGSVSVRAVFPNEEGILKNGGSGVVIIPSFKDSCIVIPQSATYEIQNKVFAYKVVDGVTQSCQIEVFKLNDGKEYIVESGLSKGDVIISEGAGLLRDGVSVEKREEKL